MNYHILGKAALSPFSFDHAGMPSFWMDIPPHPQKPTQVFSYTQPSSLLIYKASLPEEQVHLFADNSIFRLSYVPIEQVMALELGIHKKQNGHSKGKVDINP